MGKKGDWKIRLSEASRDRRKLILAACVIAAVSMVLALVVDVWWRQAPVGEGAGSRPTVGGVVLGHAIPMESFERVQEALLRPPKLRVQTVVWFFLEAADLFGPDGAGRLKAPEAEERGDLLGRAGPVVVGELLEKTDMDGRSRRAFDLWARAILLDGSVALAARDKLVETAKSEGPPKYANLMLADLARREGDVTGAMAALGREEGDVADRKVRRDVFDLALDKKDHAALVEIQDSLAFEPVLTWRLRRDLAAEIRDYAALLGAVFMTVFGKPPGIIFVFLTLLGAASWFAILVSFIGFSGHRWWGFLIPFFAGALSVVPTLFFLILQEDLNGFTERKELPHDLLYFIAGVGMREEVSKLLIFALFLPFLLRKRSPAHALITAACVGLGFAAEENISYITGFLSSGSPGGLGVAFTRYVTATGIHVFLTGILGYALYWMCLSVRRYYEQFLIAFIFAVVIHGLYDVVLSEGFARLSQGSRLTIFDGGLSRWITIAIIAACAYRFFDLVDASRLPGRRLISPLGLFVVGGATIFGSSLMAASGFVAFGEAFSYSGKSALGVAIIAWIYINRFRHE